MKLGDYQLCHNGCQFSWYDNDELVAMVELKEEVGTVQRRMLQRGQPTLRGFLGRWMRRMGGSGEYLTNWDGNRNDYCGQCGQKIDWREEDEQE